MDNLLSELVKNIAVVAFLGGAWGVLLNHALSQQVKACHCRGLMGTLGLMGGSQERGALQTFSALQTDHFS